MEKDTKKYWWLFFGFVLFGSGIVYRVEMNIEGARPLIWNIIAGYVTPLLGAAFLAWGFSKYK